ncbi:hypothetical protein Krac_10333 [Ktedonobacter racemifer DSM 44963]|uniref:Uncharacterized protein n=1 Tax=Ktedonobacter racemifer DSM 44963 TaxID=485913 RepID=D6TGQ2_KTERA|nr:hypothetical protein Krac_10333 [Ktedonobacter racemifer DSM 44963]
MSRGAFPPRTEGKAVAQPAPEPHGSLFSRHYEREPFGPGGATEREATSSLSIASRFQATLIQVSSISACMSSRLSSNGFLRILRRKEVFPTQEYQRLFSSFPSLG